MTGSQHHDGCAMRRRDFLRDTLGAAVAIPCALFAASCASLLTRHVATEAGIVRLPFSQYPELTRRDGSLKILPEGNKDPIYVFAASSTEFIALSSLCTHLQCTVALQGSELVCPCHGSTFDRQGKVVRGPAELPLMRYRAEVSRDSVLLIYLGGERQNR